ncbi:hypothetical protein CY34DRAFT_99092, partial [Suillus luteus UH-Slu-Lm8-n1]
KIPNNWEEMCENMFLHLAYTIKEEDIPAELYVNSNQTQLIYTQGSNLTWAKTGSKQVSTIGNDEKHAFTIMVSITNSGTVLLLQAIYQGHLKISCPSANSHHYDKCMDAGFLFECSNTKTYWSTQETMCSLVDKVIAKYFNQKKEELGLPLMQKIVWQIDAWSVHRLDEFHTWMKNKHPTIILNYVPGGCMGLFQPCDVGIQHIFKHLLK